MGTVKVGIREFREKLASYLLEAEQPLAITRHGDTVGYYIPARPKRTEAERAAPQGGSISSAGGTGCRRNLRRRSH
jgi:PHD/YefM family antitoxin component YafN of YafNO toxin-antitoxin module